MNIGSRYNNGLSINSPSINLVTIQNISVDEIVRAFPVSKSVIHTIHVSSIRIFLLDTDL